MVDSVTQNVDGLKNFWKQEEIQEDNQSPRDDDKKEEEPAFTPIQVVEESTQTESVPAETIINIQSFRHQDGVKNDRRHERKGKKEEKTPVPEEEEPSFDFEAENNDWQEEEEDDEYTPEGPHPRWNQETPRG